MAPDLPGPQAGLPPAFLPLEAALVPGRLLRRYKRFLADVELADGRQVTAHCPNSGSMLGMQAPGSPVLVRHVPDPRRKLAWTWEMVQVERPGGPVWVGCNTMRPNDLVERLLRMGMVPGLDASGGLRREVPYGRGSRIDILLGDAGGLTYVEVKNTTLEEDGVALFPDAVTARGAKHMDELARAAQDGHGAAVVFFVNRGDCARFDIARRIDPAYGQAFDRAEAAGVRMIALAMDVAPDGWRPRGVLPRA